MRARTDISTDFTVVRPLTTALRSVIGIYVLKERETDEDD